MWRWKAEMLCHTKESTTSGVNTNPIVAMENSIWVLRHFRKDISSVMGFEHWNCYTYTLFTHAHNGKHHIFLANIPLTWCDNEHEKFSNFEFSNATIIKVNRLRMVCVLNVYLTEKGDGERTMKEGLDFRTQSMHFSCTDMELHTASAI